MAKIEISTIRQFAANLVELNEGHLLYQNKKYEDFNFEINKIPTLSFKASAFFDGKKVSLVYSNEAKGDCSCNLKGLCRHEVCLFFILRDKLNETFKDKQSELEFFNNARQDEFMQELMEINISRSVEEYYIYPIISILGKKILLSFEFETKTNNIRINNILDFLDMIEDKKEYEINKTNYQLDYKYFSASSQKLLDLCYLNRHAMKCELNYTEINNEFMTFIYSIYKEEIYYSYNSYMKKIKFKEEFPPVKIIVDEKKLSLNNLNCQIIMTHSKTFVFMSDYCYVISGYDKIYAKLLNTLVDEKTLDLNDNNFEIFLNNIYPLYSKQITYLNYKAREEIQIDTYFDYENGKMKIKYEGDFKDDTFYLKKKNYKILIKTLGFTKANDYKINDFDMICDIINNKLDLFKSFGNVYLSQSITNLKFVKMSSQKLNFKMKDSIISLSLDGMKFSPRELQNILIAYKNNKHYVELEDGSIVDVDPDTAKLFTSLKEELGIDEIKEEIKVPLYQAYFISSRYKDIIETNDILDSFSNDLINYKDYNIDTNSAILNTLRDYQHDGFKWLYVLASYNLGGILADDMGLGKTLEIISLIDSLPKNRPYLICAPTSLIFNWQMEFEKFAPHLPICVIYGINRNKDVILDAYNNNKILITSYESLRMDIEKYEDLEFRCMIIDEAQYIKNPDALKTIAVKKIKADCKFALTGTPIENSLLDLWSIFDFALPGYLKSKNEFIKQYENFTNPVLLAELNKKTSPFILRRLKGDVLDLEDKIENFSFSFMSDEERKLYDAYLLKAREEISSGEYKITHVLSLLTRLRELACEPRLFLDDVKVPNSKMDLLMETVKEKSETGHKMLIFSQFTSIFPFMQERLDSLGIKYLILTGKTQPEERMKLVQEYNSNPDIKVFLISLKAGGTGLNLTSADTVIHYDPWWNLAAMNQATDRAHRLGQKNIVHVIKMINKNTIEDKIVELQNKKKYLTDEVINDEDIMHHLTKDDIKELFK